MACKDQNQKWCPEFQVWRDKAPIEVTCVCIWDDSWSCGSRDCGVVDFIPFRFSSVQFGRSVVSDSATPWTTARQASLSITNSQSLLKLMSIEWVMPSNHLILCRPLLLLPSIFRNIRVFSSESVLLIRWPKDWSFSFSISPSNDYSGLISFRMDWLDLLLVQGTPKSLLQHHSSKASTPWCSAFFMVHNVTSIHDCWKNHSFNYLDQEFSNFDGL